MNGRLERSPAICACLNEDFSRPTRGERQVQQNPFRETLQVF